MWAIMDKLQPKHLKWFWGIAALVAAWKFYEGDLWHIGVFAAGIVFGMTLMMILVAETYFECDIK